MVFLASDLQKLLEILYPGRKVRLPTLPKKQFAALPPARKAAFEARAKMDAVRSRLQRLAAFDARSVARLLQGEV